MKNYCKKEQKECEQLTPFNKRENKGKNYVLDSCVWPTKTHPNMKTIMLFHFIFAFYIFLKWIYFQ